LKDRDSQTVFPVVYGGFGDMDESLTAKNRMDETIAALIDAIDRENKELQLGNISKG
jgi:hypothetical protein